MKAIDYYNEYLSTKNQLGYEKALVECFRKIVLEVNEIAKMRSAKTDTAYIAIFKEQNKKAISFIKMVNQTEPFVSDSPLIHNAFLLFIKQSKPDLAAILEKHI